MIDSLVPLLALGAGVVAVLAAWFHVPRVPELDAERWFKVILATMLRGRAEQENAGADDWADRVLREVPYHPAGRFPERKVTAPETWVPVGAYLEGEQALIERLRGLPDPIARWRCMYLEDEPGLNARLSDPSDLGPAYSFDAMLGGVDGWAAIARAGADDVSSLRKLVERMSAVWVLVEGRGDREAPSLLASLAEHIGAPVRVIAHDEGQQDLPSSLLDSLQDEAAVIVVGEDLGALRALKSLAERPALRDRVEAVVAISAPFGGVAGHAQFETSAVEDWMGAWFGHDTLDTDRVWPTPYLSMQWVDVSAQRPGLPSLPIQEARFPAPRSGALQMLEVLDLGPLMVGAHPPVALIAASLLAVTSGFVLTRRAGAGGAQ